MARIDYVILYVADLDRSVGFYRDVVGLPYKLTGDGYAELDGGGIKLGLLERERAADLIGRQPGAPGPDGEVLVLTDDVDADAERLRAAGVQILSGPADRPWGHRTLHVADPDGHVVELAQEIRDHT